MIDQPAIAALNHLLAQSGWAQARLAKFSGRTARFKVAPFSFACTIQNDGLLGAVVQDASADAELDIAPSLLPLLALNEEEALKQVAAAGDTALIEEIFFLARNLRWDAAEDISRITGDIAAERIVNFAKGVQQNVRAAALNLSQAVAEFWTEERPLLAKPQQIADFARGVDRLSEEVGRLEKRINGLAQD